MRGPFRGGQVHVLVDRCSTCIFRPGNLMHLDRGRVKDMVQGAIEGGGAITCHATLYRKDVEPAVCRGFYDSYGDQVLALELAPRLGKLTEDPVPPKQET